MSELFEHGYAIVIGVDENNIQRLALPTVAKDVQAVHDVLVHPERCAYQPDNVKLLKGAGSNKKDILDALFWLQEKIKNDAEATAVIYYSGHGMVDKETNQYYLIPYDIRAMSRVRADAIKAEELTAEISAIKAKRMLAILDCCHAAGMDVKDIDPDGPDVDIAPFPIDLPETKNIPNLEMEPGGKAVIDLMDGEGRAVLNSSTGAQSSYIRTDGAMSLFTYHLIEALTGHAPHPEDATVVYVTDVMSWVTHKVKQSAKEQNRDQTPVMRTSGVFPVAQLIGGQGVAKGLGGTLPDPLAPLPAAINVGGDYIGGDKVGGDKVGGDKVEGDKISVGNISGSQGIAIGRGASANVHIQQGLPDETLNKLFAPLLMQVAQQNPAVVSQVNQLKEEAGKGEGADDEKMADLISAIAEAAPTAVEGIVNLFTNSLIAKAAGAATKYVLKRISK